jgi:chemotaxis signal transduction protein
MIADVLLTELLLLRHGAEYFALELTAAVEAMELPALAPLPDAPALLLGVFRERGSAIPVFSASRLLEVEGLGTGGEVLVIVRDGDREVGLVVDEVEDVIMANLAAMQQPIDSMRGQGLVRGLVRAGARLVAVLDARAIVRIGARALPALA